MQIRRNLVTGLIGLAMIAAPITAAAKDNDSGRNSAHQAQAQSRPNESRPAIHNEAREQHNDRAEVRNPAPQMNRHEGGQERNARVETRQAAPAVRLAMRLVKTATVTGSRR
jgi:Ni/Co efflux regulator RcnB